jgi:hypothetical protein
MRDLLNKLSPVVDVPALLRTGNAVTNGAGANLQGFDSAVVQFFSGALTDGSVACKIQEATLSDYSDAVDVAAADTTEGSNAETLAAADDNVVKSIGYRGTKQFVRGVMTQSGATSGGTYGSNIIRGNPAQAPTS